MQMAKRVKSGWVASVTEAVSRQELLAAARVGATVVQASDRAKGDCELLLERAFKHPRDEHIRFHEESHSYFLDGRRLPLSVTGLYTRYFEHFDSAAVLEANTARWRRTPSNKYNAVLVTMDAMGIPRTRQAQLIQEAWAANGDCQSALGTALHRAIELTLNEEPIPPPPAEADDTGGEEDAYGLVEHLAGPTFNLPRARAVQLAAAATAPEDMPPCTRSTFPVRNDVVEFGYYERWRASRPELVPVRTEWSIYAEDMMLAGQLDALFWDTEEEIFHMVVRRP